MWTWKQNTDAKILSRLGRVEGAIPYALRGGKDAASILDVTSVPSSAVGDGQIILASSGVQTTGSIPPTASVAGFAATATTTSITWYWDGTNSSMVIVINRADNTAFTIPGGSLTISNLTANTWYGFLPFWIPDGNSCTVGWVTGDSGSPQIAFAGGTGASFVPTATAYTMAQAAALQNLQGREPLSVSPMTFQTPNAGTSSGSAGGGGNPSSGYCVMLGTDIEPLGESRYRNIHVPCSQWWRIVTESERSLNGTHNHPLYNADSGKVDMSTVKPGHWLITDTGEDKVVESHPFTRACTKVHTEMETGHLYWANHFLSHNGKGGYNQP